MLIIIFVIAKIILLIVERNLIRITEPFYFIIPSAYQREYQGCINDIRKGCRHLYYKQIINEKYEFTYGDYSLSIKCKATYQRKVCRGVNTKETRGSIVDQNTSTTQKHDVVNPDGSTSTTGHPDVMNPDGSSTTTDSSVWLRQSSTTSSSSVVVSSTTEGKNYML